MIKNIWLIGASEGIGESLLKELIKTPDNRIIISARNAEKLKILSLLSPDRISVLPIDVSVNDCVAIANNFFQDISIDHVIYCAGYYKPLNCKDAELDEALKMLEVNLLGAFRALQTVIPKFVAKKAGHIVLIGSVAAYRGLPNAYGYGASKAGIVHFAENLKCDLAHHNIKVQVINPGFVKTRLTDLNNFKMPSIITAETAAKYIIKAMNGNHFESSFPFVFSSFLKFLAKLPYNMYFWLMKFL